MCCRWLPLLFAILPYLLGVGGIRQQQCPHESLHTALAQKELWQTQGFSGWTYPTNNRLYQSNLTWWKVSKETDPLEQSQKQAIPPFVKAVVIFYFSPSCPYSKALRPVMECLPKFFAPSIIFFAVDVATFPSKMVLSNGIWATPILRLLKKDNMVSADTKNCNLETLIDFVEVHSGQEAVDDLTSISKCGSLPKCSCSTEVAPVTAENIAELGNNRWMLLACIFLVAAGAYSLKL